MGQTTRREVLVGLAASGALAGCGRQGLAPSAQVGRAAFLAPLTGRAAPLGQAMRIAAGLGGPGLGASAEVEILDSGDSPESAARAARAAVDAGAKLIIGPLFRDQTPAVVKASRNVPVISLSNDTDLAKRGAWVFGLTPEQSAQAILGYAASQRARRIVVVVPEGPLGARSVKAAKSLAKPLGLNVSATEHPGGRGVAKAVREVAGPTPPDAVYLPAGGAPLAAQAEGLRSSELQILGSAQWLGADLGAMPGLEGAWFSAPDPLRFEPFAKAMEAETGASAGILAGLAFDAVEMARLLGRMRAQSAKGLRRTDGFDGVLGPFRFPNSKICQRGLGVLGVQDGGITLIGSTAI